jgi:pilus assembly protein CpaB
MRTKSLVLIIIALGCGLVASIGISEVLKQKPQGAAETEPILVAAIDIDIGKKLDAQNVKVEQWPKGKVPEGAVHTLEEVEELFTRSRMYAGEPVLSAKLMDSGQASGAIIPDGYRVVPVRVELDTVIGLIQPGDLVDVMVFLRQGPDVPRTGSYTILRMARVFAVNSQTDRNTEEKGQEVAAKTVSLLVKPKQAERLTLATELGKIRLALRRPEDTVPDDEEVVKDLPAIFRDAEMVAMDDPQKPTSEPTSAFPVPQVVLPPTAVASTAVWTMRVMSPTEIKQFDWSNELDLPQESAPTPLAPAEEPSTEPSEEATSETEPSEESSEETE